MFWKIPLLTTKPAKLCPVDSDISGWSLIISVSKAWPSGSSSNGPSEEDNQIQHGEFYYWVNHNTAAQWSPASSDSGAASAVRDIQPAAGDAGTYCGKVSSMFACNLTKPAALLQCPFVHLCKQKVWNMVIHAEKMQEFNNYSIVKKVNWDTERGNCITFSNFNC